jgi:hypothetical protein
VSKILHTILNITSSYLESSPFYALVALTLIACVVCIPVTQYKTVYGDTVGYGSSICFQVLVIRAVFPPEPNGLGDVLTYAVLFWGVRLSVYLFIRDRLGYIRDTNGESRFKRLTVAIGLCMYYALVTIPLLYALRHGRDVR